MNEKNETKTTFILLRDPESKNNLFISHHLIDQKLIDSNQKLLILRGKRPDLQAVIDKIIDLIYDHEQPRLEPRQQFDFRSLSTNIFIPSEEE